MKKLVGFRQIGECHVGAVPLEFLAIEFFLKLKAECDVTEEYRFGEGAGVIEV